jgi:hypothetical protein
MPCGFFVADEGSSFLISLGIRMFGLPVRRFAPAREESPPITDVVGFRRGGR